jgi:hypothetical protein
MLSPKLKYCCPNRLLAVSLDCYVKRRDLLAGTTSQNEFMKKKYHQK